QQVGVPYERYAVAAAALGGCSLRRGAGSNLGIVIGPTLLRGIDDGIHLFGLPYLAADGGRRARRGDPNGTPTSSGAVTRRAAVPDQVAPLVRGQRRLRGAARGAARPEGLGRAHESARH